MDIVLSRPLILHSTVLYQEEVITISNNSPPTSNLFPSVMVQLILSITKSQTTVSALLAPTILINSITLIWMIQMRMLLLHLRNLPIPGEATGH